jgi:hypothetical protein
MSYTINVTGVKKIGGFIIQFLNGINNLEHPHQITNQPCMGTLSNVPSSSWLISPGSMGMPAFFSSNLRQF